MTDQTSDTGQRLTQEQPHASAPRADGQGVSSGPDVRTNGDGRQEGDAREERQGLTASPPEFQTCNPIELPDAYSTRSLDRSYKAHLARFTLGVTPFGLSSTFAAWWIHLLGSPGKHVLLMEKTARKLARLLIFAHAAALKPQAEPCIEPLPHDHRFDGEAWNHWPFNLMYQTFLLTQQWWHNATNDVDGLSREQEQVVSFITRQLLDMVAPSNFVLTNPEVARTTFEQGGSNVVLGFQHFLEDWERAISGKPPLGAENYLPGRDVAVTPGKVVYQNRLIELIQYEAQTDSVKNEPILIVPAWIMKFYILDLSPNNSLVKYLVQQGYTVFIISWRNPTAAERDLGMEDYLKLGVDEAINAVSTIVPDQKIHGVGYCIGGTLLQIAAALRARDRKEPFASLTFLATQADFTERGELGLFISESEVDFIEDMMWDQGYLDTKQMSGAFQLLRSNDLIWSRYIHEYLMGKRQDMFDLMAWNADATRMPQKMHSQYLRRIFLDNELALGRFEADGRLAALSDIREPVFCVATTQDHVAPWRSVYQLHLLADTDVTFLLTNGGHNAGIVSEPGHQGRRYHVKTTKEGEPFMSPEQWQNVADGHEGSWWPEWVDWLGQRSSGEVKARSVGGSSRPYQPTHDAPGSYVYQR